MKKTLSCFVVFALLNNSNLYANSKYQISGKVELEFDKGKPSTSIPTAVVYVTGFEEAAPSKIIEISQKNEAFDPSLSFLVQGQSIKFINKDKKSHNIFSNSKAREFDLGTKEPNEEEIVKFPDIGIVDVFCNIHPNMQSKILILPNKAFAKTDAQGHYTIKDIPEGDFKVYAWHPWGRPISKNVSFKNAKNPIINWQLKISSIPPSHLNKYNKPYREKKSY